VRKSLLLLLVLPFVSAADRGPTPHTPEQAVKAMVVPEGFVATLAACEPDIVQPVSFCFDDRGRMYVAEALNYGTWKSTGKDRIAILEDTDGDGRFEKRTLFYEGFNYITGIEIGFGGVWVMSPPNLYFVPDRDGDDKPDGEPEIVFDGFGHKESRHNLANGFNWGPDGWLYFGHGRTSPSEVGRPGTPAEKRTHCDGGVCRIHPTRRVFENFADGTTNPWGVAFDDFGQCFVSNCVNPHLFHMIQGGHYEPWRNRPGSQYAYDRIATCADHLHYPGGKWQDSRGDTPEVLAMGGGHAHCGTLVYLGGQFPAEYRGSVYMCNVHGRRINRDVLKRKGSGYVASHGKDFMLAGDPWFMGVTLRAGPTGSIFVSDWSDTGECHTANPDRTGGRIYQISYGKPPRFELNLPAMSDAELAKLQTDKNDWLVEHSRRLLQERAAKPGWKGDEVHKILMEMIASQTDPGRRLRALWALHVTGGLNESKLLPLLSDGNEYLRAWSIQLLCEEREPSVKAVGKFAELALADPSPVVRLYVAAALQRLPVKSRWVIAGSMLGHAEDAKDPNLPLMYWYTFEPLIPADPQQAMDLALAGKIPLVRRFTARRFVDAELAKGNKADLNLLAETLATAGDAERKDLLTGTREGLQGRKNVVLPKDWPAAYEKLAASRDAEVRESATVLAVIFGDPVALANLKKIAASANAALAERKSALQTLIDKRIEGLPELLFELLKEKPLRAAALRGLATVPHEKTAERILAVYTTLNAEEKADAIATLASRKEYALALLDAVEKKAVPSADVSAFVARQLYAINDAALTERLRKVWGEVRESAPQKQEQIAQYKKLMTPAFLKAADRSNGRLLFSKSCQQCHSLFGEGTKIGPDLTGSNRSNLDYLLSNIIDPSAEVGRDFRMSAVSTLDGRLVTGIILERTPARIVIQTEKEKLTISADDIDAVKDSPLSMMPEGQLEPLTKEQVRDLIGYLAGDKQVPLPMRK
jgi:putative membrane-bound dehydrogenase-like protein